MADYTKNFETQDEYFHPKKVDEEKQTHQWYINVDLEIHCFCGQYIQNCEEDEYYKICPNCGQKWLVTAKAVPVDE